MNVDTPSASSHLGSEGGLPSSSSNEQRRLRRLHEACARCRRKKIKCDSTLPNCGACQLAGERCTQEDRHRQAMRPRGYVEELESTIAKCVALLTHLVSNFSLSRIDDHLADHGIPFPVGAHAGTGVTSVGGAAPLLPHPLPSPVISEHSAHNQQQSPYRPGSSHPGPNGNLMSSSGGPSSLAGPSSSSSSSHPS